MQIAHLIITKHSMLEQNKIDLLNEAIPAWAVKPHPAKQNMTAIHPMAIIERLNNVFGVGGWIFETEYLNCVPFKQKTQKGERDMYMSAVKGTLKVLSQQIHIEQYGGSSNDDMGDALKGGATDALTKCASYLGVGASIYRGQGNQDLEVPMTIEEACQKLKAVPYLEGLKEVWESLPANLKKDNEVQAMKEEMKNNLTK